jgi:hypothetical protein
MAHYVLYVYFGKERRVSSCLILDDDGKLIARGLAFCSFMDQPNKKRGRMIAEGRAMKALENATSDGSSFAFLKSCRPEVEQILEESGVDLWPPDAIVKMVYLREIPEEFRYKAEYIPLHISAVEMTVHANFIKKLRERQALSNDTVDAIAGVIECNKIAAVEV